MAPPPNESMVIVWLLLSADIVALAPAINVNVSADTFATTLFSPCTAKVLNASLTPLPPPPPEFVIVTESFPGSVVSVIPEPATNVRVSALLSATI